MQKVPAYPVCVSFHYINPTLIMSRSHRRPSGYSRGNSPHIDHTLSVTEASFQNLGLSETAGAPQLSIPSSYQSSSRRRPSALRSEVSSDYLTTDYDPTAYRRTSPAFYPNPQSSSTYGSSLLESDYDQLFADTTTYNDRASPFPTSSLSRTAMGYVEPFVSQVSTANPPGSYPSYPQDTLPPGYRETGSYAASRSPSQRGKLNFLPSGTLFKPLA